MMQIIEQTHDEKVVMYMKGCTKKQLAEMLANCNEILSNMSPTIYQGLSQKCPVCIGMGYVSYPYGVAAGQQWTSTDCSNKQCHRCGGSGTIVSPSHADDPSSE